MSSRCPFSDSPKSVEVKKDPVVKKEAGIKKEPGVKKEKEEKTDAERFAFLLSSQTSYNICDHG